MEQTIEPRNAGPKKLPGPGAALILFAVTLSLNLVITGILFLISEDLGVLLGEPLAILLPTLALVRFLGLDIRSSLRLELPSGTDLLLTIPLAFSLAVVNDQLTNLTDLVFPLSEEFQEGMVRLLRAENLTDWAIKILGVGVGAAVSEELLFRGFIQRGFEQGLGRAAALFLSAFLFAVMHLVPQGIPSYTLAGVVLGLTAAATGSIVIPILLHFIYNTSAVALVSLTDIDTLGKPVWVPAEILIPSLLIFGLIIGYFIRKAASLPGTPETESPSPDTPVAFSLPSQPEVEPFPSIPPLEENQKSFTPISPGRRRLGWLAVGCASALGTVVIVGLFTYSIFITRSRALYDSMITTMKQEVLQSIPPSARRRTRQIEDRFDELVALNRAGHLDLLKMGRLNWIYVRAISDGTISEEEMERLLEEIVNILREATPVRRL